MRKQTFALWWAVEKTPVAQTKGITGKAYSGTSPKPHYLVWKATETFGPCGIGWGFTIEDERIEEGAGGERMSIARVRVWYEWDGKRGEVEHIGGTSFSGTRKNGNTYTDEDAPKKSVTDALIKALSMIGFAGDIFMGRYDDSKYVAELNREAAAPPTDEWRGPLNKTAFKNKVGDMARALAACEYHEQVTDITDEYHDLIEQMKVDKPDWWKGAGDIVGMETKLKTAKDSLPSIETSTSEEAA